MPIEDVDYLKQNSIVQSYIFLVDSRDRDHEAHPTPSEYVTNFTAPFTNVIGLQLIDASVPRTMYNIDVYNNTISFYIHSYGKTDALYSLSNYVTATIDPGNYSIQTLLPALTAAITMNVDNNPANPVATVSAISISNPVELKNKLEFRCPYPFAFDMKGSTIAETIGFDLFPTATETILYRKLAMPAGPDAGNQQMFQSVQTNSNVGNSSYCNIMSMPFPTGAGVSNVGTLPVDTSNLVSQRFTVDQKMYIRNVSASFASGAGIYIPYTIVEGSYEDPIYSSITRTDTFQAAYYPAFSTTRTSNIVYNPGLNLVTSNITSNINNLYNSNYEYKNTSNVNAFTNISPSVSVVQTSSINSVIVSSSVSVSPTTIVAGVSNVTSNVLNIIASNVTVSVTSNVVSISAPLATSYMQVAATDGSFSTSVVQTPVYTTPEKYYWFVVGSNTVGVGSNAGLYYCSNMPAAPYHGLQVSSTAGTTWAPMVGSNQLVTNIVGDVLYTDPSLSEPYNLFVGPRGVLRKIDLSSTQYVAQRFTAPTRTFLKTVYAAFAFDSGSPVPFSINIGSATQPYTGAEYSLYSSGMNIDFVDGTLSETTIPTPILLLENVYYWIVFGGSSMLGNTAIYYNDINPYIGLHTLFRTVDSGSTWTTPDVADINYNLSIQLTVADEYNRIQAPGIFNLIGEPYITLRCPEIEQNSFRSLSFMKHSLGLAKINLGIVGYAEKRFDYNSIPARDFHPIGKFSRMTIRFETPRGQLYDFKGVNHTLTFAIRYYEPVQKNKFENSIINPNYNGDFLNYMYHRGDDNAEEDSDDTEEDYSRDNINNYRVIEARNTPERLEYEDRELRWYYKS